MSAGTGTAALAAAVKSSVASSDCTRRRSCSGSARWIFSSAVAADSGEPARPSRPAATTPSATATASSSRSISGGSRNPGRIA